MPIPVVSTSVARHLVVVAFASVMLTIIAACVTTPNITIKINDLRLPNQAQTAHLSMSQREMDVSWYYVRSYDRVVESMDGYKETIRDREPISLDDINSLPHDTKSVGIVLFIENPTLLKYRLSKVETVHSHYDHTSLYYEGIKELNEVFVPGELPSYSVARLGIWVELVGKDGTIADSLYVGDLRYFSRSMNEHKTEEEKSYNQYKGSAAPRVRRYSN